MPTSLFTHSMELEMNFYEIYQLYYKMWTKRQKDGIIATTTNSFFFLFSHTSMRIISFLFMRLPNLKKWNRSNSLISVFCLCRVSLFSSF